MKMKNLFVIIILILVSKTIHAQGSIEIVADSQLYLLMSKRLENKKIADAKPDTLIIPGYRLQVFFSNDRQKAIKIKEKLIKLFPEYENEIFLIYQSPNYKVRIGNFVKEADSKTLEKRLLKYFDNVFAVRDKIIYIKNKPQKESED